MNQRDELELAMTSPEHDYVALFEQLKAAPVFGEDKAHKHQRLLAILNQLHRLHQQQCQPYRDIVTASGSTSSVAALTELPYLAVRLFKLLNLKSIPAEDVFRTLQSSGTTSQVTAKIALDKQTSQRQSSVLVAILQQVLGKQRLPMLIIDSPATVSKNSAFSARAAGIQGLAFFGRDHTYALNDDMSINWPALNAFCEQYQGRSVLLFGFTFMVWQYFIQALQQAQRRISLPEGILLHSGGWKKLESEKVDNKQFKQQVLVNTGIQRVHNFYGMAEQVGSVFVECNQGYLHAPVFADIIIRNPMTLQTSEMGEEGIIQVLSALPTSYPGHSILTEDTGVIIGEDTCTCGWKGKYFEVRGRMPKAELRGCSDVQAAREESVIHEQ